MSVERLDILSGVVRRRRWPSSDKERIVGETLEPGATVTAVARRHDVDRSLVYRWRREFGVTRAATRSVLLPVDVASDVPSPDRRATGTTSTDVPQWSAGRIEVELPDGVRLRLEPPVDAVALSSVLRALGRR